jgi:hypothetical protein
MTIGHAQGAPAFCRHKRVGVLFLVGAVLAITGSTTASLSARTQAGAAPATVSAVSRAVAAGALISKVPSGLQPSLLNAANDAAQIFNQDCPLAEKKNDATFGECVYGNAKSTRSVILFGDSHAAMWFDSLKKAATLAGWKMRIFYLSGCPAPMITFYEGGSSCNTFREHAIAAIRTLKPTMIVVTSASFEQRVAQNTYATATQWQTGLEATLNRLKSPHSALVVLGDIPVLAQSAPDCLAAHESNVQACSTSRTNALTGVYDAAEETAAQATGARRIDVTSWLCATICPPIVNNTLVYRNQFHITRTYSVYLAGVLGSALHLSN